MKNAVNLLSLQKGEMYQEFLFYTSIWQLKKVFFTTHQQDFGCFFKTDLKFPYHKKKPVECCANPFIHLVGAREIGKLKQTQTV